MQSSNTLKVEQGILTLNFDVITILCIIRHLGGFRDLGIWGFRDLGIWGCFIMVFHRQKFGKPGKPLLHL